MRENDEMEMIENNLLAYPVVCMCVSQNVIRSDDLLALFFLESLNNHDQHYPYLSPNV